MDSGAIGSIAASYPLKLWPGEDPRLRATLDFLLSKCMYRGAFFQDMIHSGINAYLTLHLAQVLLRAGDGKHVRGDERHDDSDDDLRGDRQPVRPK